VIRNPVDFDLGAERNLLLVPAGRAGAQPIRIAATDQSRPEVMDIFVDERGDRVVDLEPHS
jgi:hypothetical protein